MKPSWQSTVIALGFIAFAGLALDLAVRSSNFSTVWAGVGSVIGVLTGAVPAYFFKQQADTSKKEAVTATTRSNLLLGQMPPAQVKTLMTDRPDLF